MGLMTLVEMRQNVETGLGDDALQRIIDGAEQEIDQQLGAAVSQVDDMEGLVYSIYTTRPVASITTIVETVGTTDTTLASSDYRLRHNSQIDRLNTGANSRNKWGDRVKVTYIPVDDTAKRRLALIKLVELSVKYNGLSSESAGDYSASSLDYEGEREKILNGLRRKGFFM